VKLKKVTEMKVVLFEKKNELKLYLNVNVTFSFFFSKIHFTQMYSMSQYRTNYLLLHCDFKKKCP